MLRYVCLPTHLNTRFKSTRGCSKTQLTGLLTILEAVPDPRVTATVDHDRPDLLTIALCTILCCGDSFYDREDFGQVRLDWLKTFLRLRKGAPTHDTYNRLFPALDPEKFGTPAWRAGRRACARCSAAKWWRWTARPCAAP